MRWSRILSSTLRLAALFGGMVFFREELDEGARQPRLGLRRKLGLVSVAVDDEQRVFVGVEPAIARAHAVGGDEVEALLLELGARIRLQVFGFGGEAHGEG